MRRERRAANVQRMKRAIRNIEVQIDELILHGTFASNRYDIGDGFSNELGLLFGESHSAAPFTEDVHIRVLKTDQIAISPQTKLAFIGGQIARAVYSSLNTMDKGSCS